MEITSSEKTLVPDQHEAFRAKEYQFGFVTDMAVDEIPKGLTEETIRLISGKKNEPE